MGNTSRKKSLTEDQSLSVKQDTSVRDHSETQSNLGLLLEKQEVLDLPGDSLRLISN